MKKWIIRDKISQGQTPSPQDVIDIILKNRGFESSEAQQLFLHPPDPYALRSQDVGINPDQLSQALSRIQTAIAQQESIVVYADYDADGITAGSIMWETIRGMGGRVMPYIPHRVEEGYGFSIKGIDNIIAQHHPSLIISVDHGITAKDKVAYAKSQGIDVIVTDHHTLPASPPDCIVVHTTQLCGAGVSWFVCKSLQNNLRPVEKKELLALACIGTIADLVPLTGANRAIAYFGLAAIHTTQRMGLIEIIKEAGLDVESIGAYEISHMLAPRLNAMGRLTHALDALRLLCTSSREKAHALAQTLGNTNRERQDLTYASAEFAIEMIADQVKMEKKILIAAHESFNEGVIGLIAGKITEKFYRPAIVFALLGDKAKASARSISGFNIIEAIRASDQFILEAGGHPMAAGFTMKAENISAFSAFIENVAHERISEDLLKRTLTIDMELPLEALTASLYEALATTAPWGSGNPQPLFASKVSITDIRTVGKDGKHLKMMVTDGAGNTYEAIGFGIGELLSILVDSPDCEIAYTLDKSTWQNKTQLQLKIRDIRSKAIS